MEKKKIMLVDDDENFLQLVKANLEATGKYYVRAEDKGDFAFSAVTLFNPDLIFLDVILADAHGLDVAAEIRNSDIGKKIPIVYLTALATKEQQGEGSKLFKDNPVLAKPVTTQELVDCIEKYTKKK